MGDDFTVSVAENLYGVQAIMKKKDVGEEVLPTTGEALRNLGRIAWPTVLEAVLVALVSLVATVMVSGLGTEAIAAVGLCTQPRFIFLAVFMSLNTGITAVISRRKGEGNKESANRTLRQIIMISAILSAVLSVVAVIFARDMLLFIGAKEDTIDLATTYARILFGGIFFNALSMNINAAQRGCGNTRVTLVTNIVANLVNVVLNYLLIEGHFGFPRLGIAGSAIATTIGFFVSFVISLLSVCRRDSFLCLNFKKSFIPEKETMDPIVRVAVSSGIEQVFMRIGFLVFAMIIANIGTMAYATHQICMNMTTVAFAFGEGLAIAGASLIGQNMGQRKPGAAQLYGNLTQRIGLTIGLILFIAIILMRRVFIGIFTDDLDMIQMGSQVMIVLAFISPAQISQVIFSTSLRVAGDTKYVAMISLVSITFIRTGLAFFLCYFLGIGLVGAWAATIVDQYIRLILSGLRFRKGSWIYIKI